MAISKYALTVCLKISLRFINAKIFCFLLSYLKWQCDNLKINFTLPFKHGLIGPYIEFSGSNRSALVSLSVRVKLFTDTNKHARETAGSFIGLKLACNDVCTQTGFLLCELDAAIHTNFRGWVFLILWDGCLSSFHYGKVSKTWLLNDG